jgi:hypothetical protein
MIAAEVGAGLGMVGSGFGVSWIVGDYEAFVNGAGAGLASERDSTTGRMLK